LSGFGKQRGEIISHYIGENDKGNAFVAFKIICEHWDGPLTSKVYITAAAMGIARAKLKAVGFDIDQRQLEELDENPDLLAGTPVQVEVSEEVYNNKPYTKCEIVTDFGKPDKPKMAALTEQLRKAKGAEGGPAKAAPSKASRRAKPSSPATAEQRAETQDQAGQPEPQEEPLVAVDNDPPPAATPAAEPTDAELDDIPF